MVVGGQHHAPASLTPGKGRYALYRRLGGPQGRSGPVRKASPPPGFDPRTVQPVASRYNDWAIPAAKSQDKGINKAALVYDHLPQFSKSPVRIFLSAADSQNLETEWMSLFRTVHNCQNISFMSTINGASVTLSTVVLKTKLPVLYWVILDSRSALFWHTTQRRVLIPQRRFGTTYQSLLQGSSFRTLKMGPVGCPENAA